MTWRLRESDMRFLLETVASYVDPDRAAGLDEAWLDEVLEDDALFERLMGSEQFLLEVSPWLFFSVLLRRARRDLLKETFTVERRSRQKVVVFDTDQVVDLLDQDPVRDYLAALLASFTRVASMTVRVNLGHGVWRRYRTDDLDVEGLLRYAEALDEPYRFEPYKRIADVCLFFSGVFPEAIKTQHRYPVSRQARPGAKGRMLQSREDYERYGRAFYQLAADHERAEVGGLGEVLTTLSANFVVAEKPLAFLADRYLWGARHQLFGF
jgi:hypothetical protein